jgi:hypothetical protein
MHKKSEFTTNRRASLSVQKGDRRVEVNEERRRKEY